MRSIIKYSTILAVSMVMLAACDKTSQPASRTGVINCVVYSEDTKSAVADADTLKKYNFHLTAYVDDDYYQTGASEPASKGAYIGSVGSPVEVSYTKDTGKWGIYGTPKWVAKDSMRFWCWYPKTLTKGKRSFFTKADYTAKDTLSFGYTLPAAGAKDSDNACDATNQADLLFAYNCKYYDDNASDQVSFKFYHALSQINFIVYPLAKKDQTSNDGSLRNDYKIVDIALQGISDTARCTIKGKPDGKSPNVSFTWSKWHEGNGTYTQYYGASFASASKTSVPDGWTYKDYSGKAHFYCNNSFFIIPETIGNNAAVVVTFQQDATKVTKLAKLNGVGTSDGSTLVTAWLPGYRYTYRLAISGNITSATTLTVTLEDWETVTDTMRF